ncbi:ATP-binding protein [Paraburkholderia ginsengisoli]|uniref:ATP-binding protein n=1 Tax=Paraburkholderia ginsengisoli TaxID=311231 RepID=A0A7T4N0S1_9BURK|nr:ATP-binding protein [Paraburkholderia ginsengisoli]QQC63163.1 ATP-binding protein [Paraburkholderia ginsengisoli]
MTVGIEPKKCVDFELPRDVEALKWKAATYRPEVGRMAGNEFVEALNPLPDDDAAFRALRAVTVQRRDEFFSRSLEHRVEAIHDVDDVFVPLSIHRRELQSTMALVRRGYLHRSPSNPKVMAHIYRCATATEEEWRSGKAVKLLTAMSPSGGAAMGRLLHGPTGSGKTTLVKRISSYVGIEPLVHTQIAGKRCRTVQLPMISIQCEAATDLKAMVRMVLEQFDVALGTDYARVSRREQSPLWVYMSQLYRAATTNFLGLLVIDDLQRLKALDERTEATLQLFSTFMQCTGIPVLAVGTNKVDSLLVSHMQEGRKLKAQGETELRALPYDEDFVDLCEMMWAYRVSHQNLEMPEFLPFALHHHTQGLLHFFNALVPELFEQMAGNEAGADNYIKGELDTAFVDKCADKALLSYQDSISVLRRNAAKVRISEEEYRRFEHLLPPRRLQVVATNDALTEQKKREDEETKAQERAAQLGTKREKMPDSLRKAPAVSTANAPKKPRTSKSRKPLNPIASSLAKSKDPHKAGKVAGWIGADLENL